MIKVLPGILVSLIVYTCAPAQNMDRVGQKDPLKITGGVSTSHVLYTAHGIASRRQPYNYFASGNLNLDLYGWSIPLSFSYSNQQFAFAQPFNQYGIRPTYKWATFYAGYNAMTFSTYTLSGHTFLGGGVELRPPGIFSVSAMGGRLRKAVAVDSLGVSGNRGSQPGYERWGYGCKAGVSKNGHSINAIFFGAKDKLHSIPVITNDSLGLLPEENVVLGLEGATAIATRISLTAEYGASALTRDHRVPESNKTSGKAFMITDPVFRRRTSTAYYQAFKSNVNYNAGIFTVGAGYERIDPEYRTLGAYFFNNDLENVTVNASSQLWKNTLNVSSNIGVQRNSLNGKALNNTRRLVYATNIGYNPGEKINFNASYSSFQTYTNIRSPFQDINQVTPYDNLDTLRFTQISQSATAGGSLKLSGTEKKRSFINISFSCQTASDKQAQEQANEGSQFYNLNTSYAITLLPLDLNITAALNANQNKSGALDATTVGPTFACNKSFFDKKMRTAASASYNKAITNGNPVNEVMNVRLSNNYTLQEKHQLSFSLLVLNRKSKTTATEDVMATQKSFSEYTGTFGYSYNF